MNETFAITRLGAGAAEEAAGISKEKATDFNPDPRRSFLPHMVAVAAEAHIRLCFLRVKRHPDANGRVQDDPQLSKYIHDLRTWLDAQGCSFIDDTTNPARTPEMYLQAGDDHMGPWAKERSTELYAEKLRPLLSP
jgi:hypothetical protein